MVGPRSSDGRCRTHRPDRSGPALRASELAGAEQHFFIEAAADFLRAQGFKLDGTFVTLRLFHLPDTAKRRELMITYGEILPGDASEEHARSEITAHAQANISVP